MSDNGIYEGERMTEQDLQSKQEEIISQDDLLKEKVVAVESLI